MGSTHASQPMRPAPHGPACSPFGPLPCGLAHRRGGPAHTAYSPPHMALPIQDGTYGPPQSAPFSPAQTAHLIPDVGAISRVSLGGSHISWFY